MRGSVLHLACCVKLHKEAEQPPEFAEIVLREQVLGKALFAAHKIVLKTALKTALDPVRRDAALEAGVVERFVAAYRLRAAPRFQRILARTVEPIYEAAKSAAWQRVTGEIREPLVYAFPRVPLEKAEGDLLLGLPVPSGLRDEALRQRIRGFGERWLLEHADRHLAAKIAKAAESIPFEVDGDAYVNALEEALGESLTAAQASYFTATAASVVTTTRAAASLTAADDAGVVAIWRTAGDEKVCSRCDSLDGMTFPVDRALSALEARLDANTPEALAEASPWLGESGLLAAVADAELTDDPGEALLSEGVGVPGLHNGCRCTLDVIGTPTFGPDDSPTRQSTREALALRMLDGVKDVPARPRRSLVAAATGFAAWYALMRFAVGKTSDLPGKGDIPASIRDLLGAIAVGDVLYVNADRVADAQGDAYNPASYALGRAAPDRLALPKETLEALFGPTTRPPSLLSAATSPSHHPFASAVEAYLGGSRRRQALRDQSPRVADFLDGLLQAREIRPVTPGDPEVLPAIEGSLGTAVKAVERATSREQYLTALDDVAREIAVDQAVSRALLAMVAQHVVAEGYEHGWLGE